MGDKERRIQVSKGRKTKMMVMNLNAIMPSQRGENIYRFSRKVSQVNSEQIISESTPGNFTIFLRALSDVFFPKTKEIDNPLLSHKLQVDPSDSILLGFTSYIILYPSSVDNLVTCF